MADMDLKRRLIRLARRRSTWVAVPLLAGALALGESAVRAGESTSTVLQRYGVYTPYDNSRPYSNDGTYTRRYGSYHNPHHHVAYRTYYSAPYYRPWYWYPYTYAYYGYSQPWYRPFYYPYVPYGYWGSSYGGWNVGVRWYPGVSYYYGGVPYYGGCYYW